ncbi:MAG: hypothetical protein EXS13_00960 [Planctomycetes bacterium]|nr:hypothetical protein [Planctomycetota bacterium]
MPSSTSATLRWFALLGAFAAVCATGGMVVPAYHTALRDAAARSLAADLSALNDAVEDYRRDHAGVFPGGDGEKIRAELLVRQLTLPTAVDGAMHQLGPFGPYLRAGIPPNPLDQSTELRIVIDGGLPGPDGAGGWLYHVPTGRFHSNAR